VNRLRPTWTSRRAAPRWKAGIEPPPACRRDRGEVVWAFDQSMSVNLKSPARREI